jgi:hypothetical protein
MATKPRPIIGVFGSKGRVRNSWVGGQRAIANDAFPTASHQTGPASLKAPSFPVIQLSVNPRTIISTISNLLMA